MSFVGDTISLELDTFVTLDLGKTFTLLNILTDIGRGDKTGGGIMGNTRESNEADSEEGSRMLEGDVETHVRRSVVCKR